MSDADKQLTIGIGIQMQDASGAQAAATALNQVGTAAETSGGQVLGHTAQVRLAFAAHNLLRGGVNGVVRAMLDLQTAASMTEGGFAGIAAAMGPVGLGLAGLVAAAAAAYEIFKHLGSDGADDLNKLGQSTQQAFDSANALAALKVFDEDSIKAIGDAKKEYDDLAKSEQQAAEDAQKVRDSQLKKDNATVDAKGMADIANSGGNADLIAAIQARVASEKLINALNVAQADAQAKQIALEQQEDDAAAAQKASAQKLADAGNDFATEQKKLNDIYAAAGITQADVIQESAKYKDALDKATGDLDVAKGQVGTTDVTTGYMPGPTGALPITREKTDAEKAADQQAYQDAVQRLSDLANTKKAQELTAAQEKKSADLEAQNAANEQAAEEKIAHLQTEATTAANDADAARSEAMSKIKDLFDKASAAAKKLTDDAAKLQVGGDNTQFQKTYTASGQAGDIVQQLAAAMRQVTPAAAGGAQGADQILAAPTAAQVAATQKAADQVAAAQDKAAQKEADAAEKAADKNIATQAQAQEKTQQSVDAAEQKQAEAVAKANDQQVQADAAAEQKLEAAQNQATQKLQDSHAKSATDIVQAQQQATAKITAAQDLYSTAIADNFAKHAAAINQAAQVATKALALAQNIAGHVNGLYNGN